MTEQQQQQWEGADTNMGTDPDHIQPNTIQRFQHQGNIVWTMLHQMVLFLGPDIKKNKTGTCFLSKNGWTTILTFYGNITEEQPTQ
jgi:hypothetical protein